jgi:hypothetical protein
MKLDGSEWQDKEFMKPGRRVEAMKSISNYGLFTLYA